MFFPGMGFSQIFANNTMSQQPRQGQGQRPMNQNMMPGMNPFAGPDPMQIRNGQVQRNPSAQYGMPQNPMQHMMQFANQFRDNQGGNQNLNAMGGNQNLNTMAGAPRFGMPQGAMNSMRKR